jgi:predicted PurR-regulated permease PerM
VESKKIEILVPAKTLFKIFLAILLIACVMKLAPLLMLLFLSLLIAVTLSPILNWIDKRGAPRWVGVLIIVLGLLGLVGIFFGVILPNIVSQVSAFVADWPRMRQELVSQIPENSMFHPYASKVLHGQGLPGQSSMLDHFLTAGQAVAGGVFTLLVVLILSVYLVVDGPRTFQWMLAFFEVKKRKKLRDTANEVSQVIFAYVAGQLITSGLVVVFSLLVLKLTHVPAALTLAVMAGIFDILPVLGFFLSAIPAILLALTVSPTTAMIVFGFYVFYHALENYFIVPKIYGDRLRVSTLTVLLSLLAADLLGGILGAIAVLPIVASYPIIERIWLGPYLNDSTIEKHAEAEG